MSTEGKLEVLLRELRRHDEAHPGSYFYAAALLNNQGIKVAPDEANELADELDARGFSDCEIIGMTGARLRITIDGKIEAERLDAEAEKASQAANKEPE